MTTSGYWVGPSVDANRVYMNWQVASQNQGGNWTDVNWQVGWNYYGSPSCRGLRSGNGYINGTSVYWHYGSGDNIHQYTSGHNHVWLQTGSGTFRINHDGAGNASIQVAAGITGWQNERSEGTSGVWALPRIPKVPATPAAPTASGITASSATVQWSAPDNMGSSITSYTLERATNSGFTSGLVSYPGLTGTSTSLTGLTRNTVYYVRVRAHNAIGESGYSSATSLATLDTVPDAPATPTVSGITPVAASVSWSAPADGGQPITGYDIQRATNSGFTTGAVTASDSASPYALSGLIPSTDYWVRVRATNSVGTGGWSASRQFKTLPGVHIGDGDSWQNAIMWVGNGSSWVMAQIRVGDGAAWK